MPVNPERRVTCPWCGARRVLLSRHVETAPECWEGYQAVCAERRERLSFCVWFPWARHRECARCGREFFFHNARWRKCCPACRPGWERRLDAARKRRRRAWLQSEYPPECARCRKVFRPKRDGARYCSGACRQAAHRKRHGAENRTPTVTHTKGG